MYCVIGENCDAVVKSTYVKTFGIENTIPGMLYYALIFVYGAAIVLKSKTINTSTFIPLDIISKRVVFWLQQLF